MNANEYLRGYLKAIDLDENVKSEHVIANVTSEDFEEKNETIRKLIVHLDDARKVVCNQERTSVLSRAFGKNTDLWIVRKSSFPAGRRHTAASLPPALPSRRFSRRALRLRSLRAAPGRPSRAGKRRRRQGST
jgi:hypothetical protein